MSADLPQSLVDIVEVIGLPSALKLVERYGGIRIYVLLPEHLHEAHPLVQTIGLEAAHRLAAAFGCETLELPMAADYLRRRRDAAIRAARTKLSASQVARQYGLTRRHVLRIWASTEEVDTDRQVALF